MRYWSSDGKITKRPWKDAEHGYWSKEQQPNRTTPVAEARWARKPAPPLPKPTRSYRVGTSTALSRNSFLGFSTPCAVIHAPISMRQKSPGKKNVASLLQGTCRIAEILTIPPIQGGVLRMMKFGDFWPFR